MRRLAAHGPGALLRAAAFALAAASCSRSPEPAREAEPSAVAPPRRAAVAVLAGFAGDARLKRADSDEWRPVRPGMELHADDKLRTHSGASATLVFASGSSLSLSENSLVAISSSAASGVRLERGEVDVDWAARVRSPSPSRPAGELVVETPSASARVAREILFQ